MKVGIHSLYRTLTNTSTPVSATKILNTKPIFLSIDKIIQNLIRDVETYSCESLYCFYSFVVDAPGLLPHFLRARSKEVTISHKASSFFGFIHVLWK